MKIKICGMRELENIREIAALRPDYLGYIFYGPSPRFAGSADYIDNAVLPLEGIIKTGVFVDEKQQEVIRLQQLMGFGAIQLHGKETPAYCRELRAMLPVHVQLIKAFGIQAEFDFPALELYAPEVDFFLFDTSTSMKGGSGQTFNWKLLDNYILDVPYWLSGGLGVEEIEELLKTGRLSPALYGFDLNSRLELGPGCKDVAKVRRILELRDAYLVNEQQ